MKLSQEEVRGDPSILIGKTLKNLGVQRIYTVCGGHISPILRGCSASQIEIIDGRDERSLAYAASIEAALTSFPGTVVCTAGPGLAYTFGAVKNAHFKGLPMVVLSGSTATALRGRGSLQDSDQLGDMVRYTKIQLRITRARDIPRALQELYSAALSGVPGPVYGEIAMDASYPRTIVEKWYLAAIGKKGKLLAWLIKKRVERLQGLPNFITIPELESVTTAPPYAEEIRNAANLLSKSQRPVILLGSRIAWSQKRHELDDVIRALGIPCFVNDLARGYVKNGNPFLFSRSRAIALKEADCVLLAGIPPDFRLGYGRWGGAFGKRTKIIRVDLDTDYLEKNLRPAVKVNSEPGEFLTGIANLFKNGHTDLKISADEWLHKLNKTEKEKTTNDNMLMMDEERSSDAESIHPVRLGKTLETFLSSQHDCQKIIIGDGGDFTAMVAREIKSYDLWLDAGPFGSLGTGMGFALAAKAARPNACVIVIFGDGAFGYSAMELHTLTSKRLGVIAIIGNNGAWAQIERSDIETYGESTLATTLPDARYEKIAEAFGAEGVAVRTDRDFSDALTMASVKAMMCVPTIINAYISSTRARAGSLAV